MFNRMLMLMSLVLAAFMLASPAADANERYGRQKVVYHINYNGGEGLKKYRGALRNIQNHINAVGADNLEVRVILHGNGVNLLRAALKDDRLKTAIGSLKSQDVDFKVCANTLRGRKINPDTDLFEVFKEDIVPSGVAELSRLQQLGYTYIKP